MSTPFKVAEFFAGIGLVRKGLESQGFQVVWANDIDPSKQAIYEANYRTDDFVLGDIGTLSGDCLPECDLATASFPCTDLSIAGNRKGLAGAESSTFWEFTRILDEMGHRRPKIILIENVPGFATAHSGKDFRAALTQLNHLGYACDFFLVNAKEFLPQSRLRLFLIGVSDWPGSSSIPMRSEIRPKWIVDLASSNRDLHLVFNTLPNLPVRTTSIRDVVEIIPPDDARWWRIEQTAAFVDSLSPQNFHRLQKLMEQPQISWRTAYRRTRNGSATWEMRSDEIAGCLRVARGGSSRQALAEVDHRNLRVRWMTPTEYARLQGAPRHLHDCVSTSKALSGYGDAVCVPVIEWIASNYLRPFLKEGTLVSQVAEQLEIAIAS